MTPLRRSAPGLDVAGAPVSREHQASGLMARFAERTGLVGGRPLDRYLWTDAFAVCNFLGLGEIELALGLVNQVHRTLGRHGVPRGARLSGLVGEEAEAHPTVGGLRIGKKLLERRADEPFDDRLEWERDGQYFHYLTKWMHALDQVARVTGRPTYNLWARELAVSAHHAFTYVPRGESPVERRMYWKMSVDLSRPLVPSMGHHDPLDGYITCVQLQATAAMLGVASEGPALADEAASFAAMIPSDLSTTDPLGLGDLLADAWRVEQLVDQSGIAGRGLRDRLLDAALTGLASHEVAQDLDGPASRRLAFRELGLAIGLAAVPAMEAAPGSRPHVEPLARFVHLRAVIEAFWLDPDHRRTATWLEHENINEVMLSTSLAPAGVLALLGLAGERPPGATFA
jgi:hypothetical protein